MPKREVLPVEHCPLHHDLDFLEGAVMQCFEGRNHSDRFVAEDARVGTRYWIDVLRWTRLTREAA